MFYYFFYCISSFVRFIIHIYIFIVILMCAILFMQGPLKTTYCDVGSLFKK